MDLALERRDALVLGIAVRLGLAQDACQPLDLLDELCAAIGGVLYRLELGTLGTSHGVLKLGGFGLTLALALARAGLGVEALDL
jgi:hypothetical protein